MGAKYRYWLHSGKYSMMQKIIMLVFGLGSFMLLARALTPNQLGVWGLFLVISGIVETSRNAFIRNGYIFFSNTVDDEKRSAIYFSALVSNVLFTLLMILLFLVGGSFFQKVLNAPFLSDVLYLYCISLVALIPFSQLEITLTAKMNFRVIFWMYFVRNGLLLFAIAIFFVAGLELNLQIISIIFATSTIAGALTGALTSHSSHKLIVDWDKSLFLKFVHYGKFIWGNNLCSLVFRNTDSFLTASFISAAASAFYSSCTRITNFADMPSQVLGDIMFPKAAQMVKKGNPSEIKLLYEKTVAATLTFTLPVVVAVLLLPKTILLVIAGNKYVNASGILQVIILYGVFLPFIKQFGNVMDVTGRPKVNFQVLLVFAILNIGFNAAGIYIFGLPGSAYGTLLSYFLLFLTAFLLLRKLMKVSIAAIFKNVGILYLDYFKIIHATSLAFFRKTSYAK